VRSGYSCAGACVSESRHALSFKRRQTQHNPSVEFGAHSPPHTTHVAGFFNRSVSIARLACSIIASGTIVSETGAGTGKRLRLTVTLYQAGPLLGAGAQKFCRGSPIRPLYGSYPGERRLRGALPKDGRVVTRTGARS
jgi:hypothetical protein